MTTYTKTGAKPSLANPVVNPERFINYDQPGFPYRSLPNNTNQEFIFVVDGIDNNGNGIIDEGFNGIDDDGDGVIDPGFNGIDDDGDGIVDNWAEQFYPGSPPGTLPGPGGEFEQETFAGPQFSPGVTFANKPYTILRRPVPSSGAREVTLPAGVVIDMTTWYPQVFGLGHVSERSRLPVDPFNGYVDILMAPNGEIVQASSNAYAGTGAPFYHFWLAERDDVYAPQAQAGIPYLLPMPAKTPYYDDVNHLATPIPTTFLKGDRRLLSIFTKTGQISTTTINRFDARTPGLPFLDAQMGVNETP
jgi:hypothetical protein